MEKSLTLDWGTDELHEECGVFGMYDLDGKEISLRDLCGRNSKVEFSCEHKGF